MIKTMEEKESRKRMHKWKGQEEKTNLQDHCSSKQAQNGGQRAAAEDKELLEET